MKRLTPLLLLICFGFLLHSAARADVVTWRSALTLGEPTEIPGTVLPPGKYMVKVLDTQETRKVVQFLSEDETKVIATVMAVPDYSVKPSEGQFTYFQRAEGMPQALKSWFYPANNYGVEFIYPKAEAMKIAEARHQEVYAAESVKPQPHEPVVAISPELKERPVTEQASAQQPAAVTQESRPVAAKQTRKTLPKTASDLPLVALAGFAALGGAATLRILAARRA